jgi:bifunctional DNA-binding transcriptional regulator/antitoxin component of YhaV-PrlF toxin-antitoxin module
MSDTYTVTLEEDENGDLIMPIPTELLAQMGWDEGDTLIWEEAFNGSYILKKQDENNGN